MHNICRYCILIFSSVQNFIVKTVIFSMDLSSFLLQFMSLRAFLFLSEIDFILFIVLLL